MGRFFRTTLTLAFAALAFIFTVSPAYATQMEVVDAGGNSLESTSITIQPANETCSVESESSLEPKTYNLKPTEGTVSEAVDTGEAIPAKAAEVEQPQQEVVIDESVGIDKSSEGTVGEQGAVMETSATANTNTNIAMKATPVKNGWINENDETHYYVNSEIQTGWADSNSYGNYGSQKYWLGAYGELETSKISKTDASGSLAYSTSKGYVARGKYKEVDGSFYLANGNGKLEGAGWLVTANYDGITQRYYVDDSSRTVKTGIFEVSGKKYYGRYDVGYCFRNDYDYIEGHWYTANDAGVLTNVDSRFARVEAYVTWMLGIAADDSHGYDQTYRWGERGDFDCSSLVICAVQAAGIDTKWATYTGNMRGAFTSTGFYCRGFENLKRGDILLNDDYHVAIYIGDGQIVHASGNEWGGATGGQPGDQTGKEICVRSYYDRPWYTVLRFNC